MIDSNSPLIFTGKIFVLGDNIDTDQIIPAQYLNLVPTIPEEYQKLGSYALYGLPPGQKRYVEEGQYKTEYSIILAGNNFGCGSSREHAPVSLGASGCQVVLARSYARIFFRNCLATGELFPVEYEENLTTHFQTGDLVTVDLNQNTIQLNSQKLIFPIRGLGDALNVIKAGGIFNFARQSGMIQ